MIKIDVKYENHLLKIDGKCYVLSQVDGKPIMKRVKKKDVEDKTKLVNELAKKLKDNLDREAVMREALWKIKLDELKKLNAMVKSERKYIPKTREGYCTDMKVGNFVIPIVD